MQLQGVSTKDLVRVRRLAARHRAAAACVRCKFAKIRCTDNRPCKKCANSKLECVDVKAECPRSEFFETRDTQSNSQSTNLYPGNIDKAEYLFWRETPQYAHLGDQIDLNANMTSSDKERLGQLLQTDVDHPLLTCGHPTAHIELTNIKESFTGPGGRFNSPLGDSSSTPIPPSIRQMTQSTSFQEFSTFLPAMQSSMLSSNALHRIPDIHAQPTSSSAVLPTVATLLLRAWDPQPVSTARTPPLLFSPPAVLLPPTVLLPSALLHFPP
jgi:hypothetical protein